MTTPAEETVNNETAKLIDIQLDASLAAVPLADVEHERQVAIFDLLQENSFHVVGRDSGPYKLRLSIAEGRLMFGISDKSNESCAIIGLALSPFRRIVKDYFMICESYFQAIRTSTPGQIETIDMARRGLHNEGSEILKARLQGKIEVDFDTARRLFTLVCVLHWRG
ncbi:MAG: UPF0262 family protein [Aestuariivirgaceae bacterium]